MNKHRIFIEVEGARISLINACELYNVSLSTVRYYKSFNANFSWKECFLIAFAKRRASLKNKRNFIVSS
jgi:hypothetical protein